MKTKIQHFLSGLLLAGLILPQVVFATSVAVDPVVPRNDQTFQPSLENQLSDKSLQQAYFLMKLRDELGNAKDDYSGFSSAISHTKSALGETNLQVTSLKDQIENLDVLIDQSNRKISAVFLQVSAFEREITALEKDYEFKEFALQDQEKLLKEYITMLYTQEHSLGLGTDDSELSSMMLLLSGDSVQDTLKNLNYLEIMDRTGRGIIQRAQTSLDILTKQKKELDEKYAKLSTLKERLKNERGLLEEQKVSKAEIMRATKGQERIYEELLARSAKQQDQSLDEIQTLRKNLDYVQKKIQDSGNNADIEEMMKLIDQKVAAIYELQSQEGTDGDWKWPVSPGSGISAFFHDGAYAKTFGVAHQAIDIRAIQRTPVRAPKDAIVYKVKDNDDSNYSYVILAHAGNFQTIYGHINESLVKEGDTVKAGDVFAFTGGMPGSKGAGYMTTGPHLHLEMLKDGQHVDPLDYLPLAYVPIDSLPERYLTKLHDQEKVKADTMDSSGTDASGKAYNAADIEAIVEKSGSAEVAAPVLK